jgi:hypothetical protein
MYNPSDEQKDRIVKITLRFVDDINLLSEVPNYVRKYGNVDENLLPTDENSKKRYFVNCREQFRKILLTNWYQDKFTESQILDINNVLLLTRQKISELFTN